MTTIGLAGFGTVGSAFAELIKTNPNYKIEQVAVRNPEKHLDCPYSLTTSPFDLVFNPDIQVIVEVMGGIYPAFDIIKTALQLGKPVITANKQVIAYHGQELRDLANKHRTFLKYEASVGGSIPIIQTLNQHFSHHRVTELLGILNGSTNYILTRLTKEPKSSVESILSDAKELGFLEADPSYDLNGWDIRQKLTILAYHAFQIVLDPAQIHCLPLNITDEDKFLLQYGSLKYLAHISSGTDDSFLGYVVPELLAFEHPLSHVSNEFNGVSITSEYSHQQMLIGKGAGGFPTASSILSDVLSLKSQLHFHPFSSGKKVFINQNHHLEQIYLRFEPSNRSFVDGFLKEKRISYREVSPTQYILRKIRFSDVVALQSFSAQIIRLPDSLFIEQRQFQLRGSFSLATVSAY